jgi:hypothetical protein
MHRLWAFIKPRAGPSTAISTAAAAADERSPKSGVVGEAGDASSGSESKSSCFVAACGTQDRGIEVAYVYYDYWRSL